MLNNNEFFKAKIINKNGESGEVVSMDEDHIIIAYLGGEKTYNPDVAIRNGFLSFVDASLQARYSEYLMNKDKALKEKEEMKKKVDADRAVKIKRVNKINKQYERKMCVLQTLFGSDFIYPPYVKFIKNYKDLITRPEDFYRKFYRYYQYGYKYH